MKMRILSVGVAALIWAGPAFAHHSFAMFDYNKDMTLVGAVEELKWTNPRRGMAARSAYASRVQTYSKTV